MINLLYPSYINLEKEDFNSSPLINLINAIGKKLFSSLISFKEPINIWLNGW